jgi:hypothetical protein
MFERFNVGQARRWPRPVNKTLTPAPFQGAVVVKTGFSAELEQYPIRQDRFSDQLIG